MAAGESETVEIQKREKRVRGKREREFYGNEGVVPCQKCLLLERLGKVYDGVIARKYALVEVSVLP